MPKPQQPELRRSGYGATSDDSAKIKATTETEGVESAAQGTGGPVPEDNRPGHHPEHEQDKPDLDASAERAQGGDTAEE
jgi:hypothetical protein